MTPMDTAPQTFGRYHVLAVLHRGRTGTVYLVAFGNSGKQMALKALDPSVTNDPVLRERFIRGARATSLVQSPHVARIYEVGVQVPSGQVWCAMELVDGRSLAEVLAEHRERGEAMPPAEALLIGRQLAGALGALHAGGVVHRNVKPANVLLGVGPDGKHAIRLCGFSLVKLRETTPGEELTARGAVMGTPAYLAP